VFQVSQTQPTNQPSRVKKYITSLLSLVNRNKGEDVTRGKENFCSSCSFFLATAEGRKIVRISRSLFFAVIDGSAKNQYGSVQSYAYSIPIYSMVVLCN